MTEPIDPIPVAVRASRIFEELGLQYSIGGSLASALAGEPRSTVDIDFVIEVSEGHVTALVRALEPEFFVNEDALRRAVRERSSSNVFHRSTSIKIDLFVAGGTPLDRQQLARRRRVTVSDDQTLYVHPPEDILLQKLRWYRMGGEVSDRQWRDVVAIVRVQGERLDRSYLALNAPVLGVSDLLERAFAAGSM